METSKVQYHETLSLPERITALETEREQMKDDIKDIKSKLDQLIELKARGMGAVWLVGIIIGSGLIGIVSAIMGLFNNKSHL